MTTSSIDHKHARQAFAAGALGGFPAPSPAPPVHATGDATLAFVLGDITHEVTEAIANPAGAGLVDLAIRRAAGPDLLDDFHRAAARLPDGRLTPGRALLTRGFALPARYVVHCGPPLYRDGAEQARVDLAACHAEALRLARAQGIRSISFPAIGTGIHRFPVHEAAAVAVRTVLADLAANPSPAEVRFVLFTPSLLNAYVEAAVLALREPPIRDGGATRFQLWRR